MKYLKLFENSDEDIKDKISNEIENYFYILEDEYLNIKCIKRPEKHRSTRYSDPDSWNMPNIILVYIVEGQGRPTEPECQGLIDASLEFIHRMEDISKKFNYKVIMSNDVWGRSEGLSNLPEELSIFIQKNEDISFSILVSEP